jgi:hypothetical protein
MKTEVEIQGVLDDLDTEKTKYAAMTYEQGIEEALMWVLEQLSDEEFSPITK